LLAPALALDFVRRDRFWTPPTPGKATLLQFEPTDDTRDDADGSNWLIGNETEFVVVARPRN
jgi:hypothetical protein